MIIIYFVITLLFLLIVLLLINKFYLNIVQANSQENHILRGLKGKYDAIALGSAYCRYGIDFSETGVNGYNFGYASQFFYYTDMMLRYIAPKCLNEGGTVYLIIADLVFASVGKKELNYKGMYRILPYYMLRKDHSIVEYIKENYPVFFRFHAIKSSFKFLLSHIYSSLNSTNVNMKSEHISLSESQAEMEAVRRCETWCKQFGMKNTRSSDIPENITMEFPYTIQILKDMISYCLKNNYNPVLVVTPVSSLMNKYLGEDFVDVCLKKNIEQVRKCGVKVVYDLRNEKFSDYKLYKNADFLNDYGRKKYTAELIASLKA